MAKGYADKISHVEHKDCRIEKIFVHGENQEEIRFSWWPGGRFVPKALDMPEHELLILISKAIDAGVFTASFLDGLRSKLDGP
jgi:hypothetical protein